MFISSEANDIPALLKDDKNVDTQGPKQMFIQQTAFWNETVVPHYIWN